MNTELKSPVPELQTIKARQKATWESGDFGQVARIIENIAEEFMARLPLKPGLRVLDVACGTGNLAVVAARKGCVVTGIDIASNLIAQARTRAQAEGLKIQYQEGDAEALPFSDAGFDVVVSMFGVMFAPQQELAASELIRVTKPNGLIALANWTPEGFIGEMFKVFRRHVTPPPGVPSPMQWGTEAIVRELFGYEVAELKMNRRLARMHFPFSPAETVAFFRKYLRPDAAGVCRPGT